MSCVFILVRNNIVIKEKEKKTNKELFIDIFDETFLPLFVMQ